ncbi:MAG: hypothetical protein IJ223_03935 [Clostridia bacterium]|nr:hypothetical protein [Clostridia bacterium]
MKTPQRKTIEINLGVLVVVIAITVIAIVLLKYHVEGEKDMPYILKEIDIISTATGENEITEENKWNIKVSQNSDVYIEIERNSEHKSNENIKKVKIQEIQIKSLGKYTPKLYLPSQEGEKIFDYKEENLAKEEIEYNVDNSKNVKKKTITSEGGIIALSFANNNIGTYIGNDDKIVYDGTLLEKLAITNDDIQFDVKFSLIIETESNKKYKAEIILKLPGGDLVKDGIIKIKNTELEEIVFKRI